MAKILSVTSSEMLKTTRQLLLEQQGYSVYSALSLAELDSFGRERVAIDISLVCHGFRGPDKLKIAQTINHYYPGLPILEMCFNSPEIPGADFVLSDSPAELLTAIKLVLAGRRVRGYTE